MLLAAMMTVALGAAPKAPVGAEVVVFVPRLDALAGSLPFFEAAGERAPLLRPASWREAAYPLLGVDVTSRASLEAAGIDPAGPLTVSKVDGRTITCFVVAKPEVHQQRAEKALAARAPLWRTKVAGLAVLGAKDPIDRVQAAVASSGREVCSIFGEGQSVEKQLPAVVKVLTGPGLPAPVPAGVVSFLFDAPGRQTVLSLTPKDLTLTAQARGVSSGQPALAGAGPSPFAALTLPAGMGVVRARVAKADLPRVVALATQRLPGAAAQQLGRLALPVATALTGNTVLAVNDARVTTGLKTPAARFFAVHFAAAAEVADVAAVRAALAGLDQAALKFPEGVVDVSLVGEVLVLANDVATKQALLAALPTAAGRQAHGAELVVAPPAVAQGLRQVPLLEAIQTPELAGFVALASELGPLLVRSAPASAWLDTTGRGGWSAQAGWTMVPEPSRDAGR